MPEAEPLRVVDLPKDTRRFQSGQSEARSELSRLAGHASNEAYQVMIERLWEMLPSGTTCTFAALKVAVQRCCAAANGNLARLESARTSAEMVEAVSAVMGEAAAVQKKGRDTIR